MVNPLHCSSLVYQSLAVLKPDCYDFIMDDGKPKLTAWHYDSHPDNFDPSAPLPSNRPSTNQMATHMIKDASTHTLMRWYLRMGLLVPVAIVIFFFSTIIGCLIAAFIAFSLARVVSMDNKSPYQTFGIVACCVVGLGFTLAAISIFVS